jgi:hypothetical protein
MSHASTHTTSHPVHQASFSARLALLVLLIVSVLAFVAGINAFGSPPSLVPHDAAPATIAAPPR